MIAYIREQGAKIVREGKRILVQGKLETHTFFSWELRQLFVYGNVTITQPALSLLLQEKIDIVYFRLDGRLLGYFAQDEPKNVFLRKQQFIRTDDKEFCLKIAKHIVHGKLHNQSVLLHRIKRAREIEDVGNYAQFIKQYMQEIPQCKDMDQLRGVEGRAAKAYFKGFSFGFSHDWDFQKRVKRPPTDPVNAVLSLCYTLLTHRMLVSVRLSHLDPAPGVLHSLKYGRYSLPLDLIEEFRPIIADSLTLALFNKKILSHESFEIKIVESCTYEKTQKELIDEAVEDSLGYISPYKKNSDNEGCDMQKEDSQNPILPVLLTNDAYKKVITAFTKKLESTFIHPVEHIEVTYAHALDLQAKQYRKILESEDYLPYQPLLMR